MARDDMIYIRLTEEEKSVYNKFYKLMGFSSLSEFIRVCINEKMISLIVYFLDNNRTDKLRLILKSMNENKNKNV